MQAQVVRMVVEHKAAADRLAGRMADRMLAAGSLALAACMPGHSQQLLGIGSGTWGLADSQLEHPHPTARRRIAGKSIRR